MNNLDRSHFTHSAGITCKDCKHSIFDVQWGEFKCKKLSIVVNPKRAENCNLFVRRTEPTKQEREKEI